MVHISTSVFLRIVHIAILHTCFEFSAYQGILIDIIAYLSIRLPRSEEHYSQVYQWL